MSSAELLLRAARAPDVPAIARIMRSALASFDWMPMMHTPEEDLAFIGNVVLPRQRVTVAQDNGGIVGFIAVDGEWVEQLYLDPTRAGRGVGSRLLTTATADMPVVKLYCFQANAGARRFYERHGFRAEAYGDGANNEERLPDILYVRRRSR